MAANTSLPSGNLDRRILALEGFFERDLHLVAEIRAAPCAFLSAASAGGVLSAHEIAKHFFEDIAEAAAAARAAEAAKSTARPAACCARIKSALEGRRAETVVSRALLLI